MALSILMFRSYLHFAIFCIMGITKYVNFSWLDLKVQLEWRIGDP